MNRTVKIGVGIGVALLIALSAAWLWGSSGKGDLQRALDVAELRNDLLTARGALLSARVDLYIVNFGDASRDFEAARTALRRAEARSEDNRAGRRREAPGRGTGPAGRGAAVRGKARSDRQRARRRRGEADRRDARGRGALTPSTARQSLL